jgi:hypothetical protein
MDNMEYEDMKMINSNLIDVILKSFDKGFKSLITISFLELLESDVFTVSVSEEALYVRTKGSEIVAISDTDLYVRFNSHINELRFSRDLKIKSNMINSNK